MSIEKTIGYEFHRGFYADVASRRVLKNGIPLRIPLTPKQYEVLEFFLQNPKRVIPREGVRPLDETSGRPHVDNYLSQITKKLGLRSRELFKLTRTVGYSLEANVRVIHASDQQEGGELYKAAEVHFFTHTVDSMRESLAQSLRALEVNPHGLPSAHITAAYNYINLGMAAYSAELPSKVMPLARQHARDALKEDPTSSGALGLLGLISLIYDYDWKEAEIQMKAALELNPNDSQTLLSHAHFLIGKGQFQKAIDAVEKAARINPTDFIIHASVGWMHLFAGDVQAAIELGEKTKSLYRNFPPAYVILGWAYEAAGQHEVARKHYEMSLEKEYSPAALASLGHLQAKLGDRRSALATLKELNQLHKRGSISYVPSYCRALVFAGLNDVEECLDALEDASKEHCEWLIHLIVERRWKPVRQTARFRRLAQRIGVTLPPDLLA